MSLTVQIRRPADADAFGAHAAVPARAGILELPADLALHHGGRLQGIRVAWRLAGAPGTPVIAALGGISAHRMVFSCEQGSGWWDSLAGPGRPIDSHRFGILGFDYLGGSGATTGPATGEAFPSISTYDQAAVLLQLIDHLDLPALHAIVGASYGGMVGLAFAERYPQRLRHLIAIGAADRSHPLATAWRSVQRRIVRFAIGQRAGAAGLELARALAMITYRSGAEFAERFGSPGAMAIARRDGQFVFPVEEYLFARGAQYAAHYRPESFLCLSESIDLHAVEAGAIDVPVTLVAVREDQLVPASDVAALAARLGARARLHELSSLYGHDAFLKEREQLAPIISASLTSSFQ